MFCLKRFVNVVGRRQTISTSGGRNEYMLFTAIELSSVILTDIILRHRQGNAQLSMITAVTEGIIIAQQQGYVKTNHVLFLQFGRSGSA